MTVFANNFIWINKDETANAVVADVLEDIQDTDASKESGDARLYPKKMVKPPVENDKGDILLDKEGTMRLERSQYTEDMMGVEDPENINNKNDNKKE